MLVTHGYEGLSRENVRKEEDMHQMNRIIRGSGPIEGLTPLYTVSQVAKYLGVHPHTVYRYLQEGRIKAVKIGQTYRFTSDHINEYIASCFVDNS